MVLPGTWSAALILIFISIICFGLWPNLFKLSGTKWRFELYSFDFAAGALLLSLIAAYTLGTLGSSLDFSDNMLVAGRREEAMAVVTGGVFAFANMLYLATIALFGLSNATLLTFSVFGCTLSLLEMQRSQYVTSTLGFAILVVAVVLSIASARAKRAAASASRAANAAIAADEKARLAQPVGTAPRTGSAKPPISRSRPSHSGSQRPPKAPLPPSTKGAITGILGGLFFGFVAPVLKMAQPEQLGIGAYGGLLLAAVGILVATFFFNFFFLNLSLEGGRIGYSTYFTGTLKTHLIGGLSGMLWAAGALALYTAYTGTAGVTRFDGWIAPFAGALLAMICGLLLWQKIPQPEAAKRSTLLGLVFFVVGIAVLLFGFRR